MQVANYGLGGQYSQHTDPHGYWDGRTSDPGYAQTGDRLLTIMVYLASVEAGGATSFPVTGNRIAAKSGDAAIWVRGPSLMRASAEIMIPSLPFSLQQLLDGQHIASLLSTMINNH